MSRAALLAATCLSGLALAATTTPAVANDLFLDASSLTETAAKTYRYVWTGYPNGPSNYVIQNTSVTAEYSIVGYGSDNNSATVTGTEAFWNTPGYIIVGAFGSNNELFVEAGGKLSTSNVTLGDVNSTGNTVTVTGAGSAVNGSSIVVGNNGGGNTLSVEEGGTTTVADVLIGYAASGNTVNVTGTDSKIESSTVTVGYFSGSNTLQIEDGGTVITNGNAFIGRTEGSDQNTAIVTGAGSSWSVSNRLFVGAFGDNNTLRIEKGGVVNAFESRLGDVLGDGSGNKAIVTGAGSRWNSGSLIVGSFTSGATLDVLEGGALRTLSSSGLLGGSAVSVIGQHSLWSVGTSFTLGIGGNTLTVRDGGLVTVETDLNVGGPSGTSGLTPDSHDNAAVITGSEVEGEETRLTSSRLYLGSLGNDNSVTVESGGRLETTEFAVIGARETRRNHLSVVGEGSLWTVAGNLAIVGSLFSVDRADANRLTVDDSGRVSIGGRLSVGGNGMITLGAGSVLEADSLALSPLSELGIYLDDERNARLAIAGTAELDGTLKVSIGTDQLRSNRYTVLTAGTVTGTFDALSFGTLADGFDDTILATATLDYSGDLVSLLFEADIGGRNSLSDNQSNVATAINRYFNAGGTLPESFVPLLLLSGGALTATLDQLSGEVGASGGAQVANDAMSDFLGFLITADAPGRQQTASAKLGDVTVIPAADVAPSSGWSMWGKAFGGTANLPGDDEAGSNRTDTGLFGFATGWDHALTSDATLGFAIAGGGTRWDVDNGLGEGESTFLQLGAHGAQRFGASYLSLAGAYAWHWMETERRALSDSLTAEFIASTIGGRIEAGHRFAAHDDLGLTPYAALQAQAAFLPDYREDGGAAALAFDEKTASTIRSELGLRFDMTADAVRLFGRLAWAHDWTSDPEIDASFQSLPGAAFTVSGAEAPDNIALASLGLEASLSDRASLNGGIEGELGEDHSSLAGTIALRFSW